LWEYSDDYFHAFEDFSCLRKDDLAIAAVPELDEGLNRLFNGFNWSAHNLSNPVVRGCL